MLESRRKVTLFAFAAIGLSVAGLYIGYRLSRPAPGEVEVSREELWRHGPNPEKYKPNPRSLAVAVSAFGGCLVAGGLGMLADYIDARPLRFFSAGAFFLCFAVTLGAMLNNAALRKGKR